VYYREQGGPMFLSSSPWNDSQREHSEQTAREIDMEVRKILDDATEEVRAILRERQVVLEAVAQRLVEKEGIDGGELRQLLEEYNRGPKLVPGTLSMEVRTPAAEAVDLHASEQPQEGGASASAGVP